LSFVLVSGLALTSVAKAADPALLGWWQFDEGTGTTVKDSSGNGHDGTLIGGATWTTGRFGGGIQLNGTSAYVSIPSFSLTTNTTTWVAWLKGWKQDSWAAIVTAQPVRCELGFGDNNTLHYTWNGDSSATWGWAGGPTVAQDTWTMLAMVLDASKTVAYAFTDDGGLVSTTNNVANIQQTITQLQIGWSFGTRFVRGTVDEVQVYNRALSELEIRALTAGPTGRGKAASPIPKDGATDVPRDAAVSWAAGEFAKTHDVYFGSTFEDVNNASLSTPLGVLASAGQAVTTFDPAGLFAYGKPYYWRIDEVNAPDKPGTYKGTTWSFTAEPYAYPFTPVKATASSSLSATMGPEKTIDRSGLDSLDQHATSASQMWLSKKGQSPIWIQYEFDKAYKLYEMWVWNSNQTVELDVGFGAKDVKVETSLDGTTWAAVAGVSEFNQATGEPNYVHNTTVSFGGVQAKYVKITISDNWADSTKQAGLSEVRFFYVPVKAFEPTPANAAAGFAVQGVLNWRSGREAAKHDVYVSADSAAVTAGTAPVKTVTDHKLQLAPLGLQYGTTYYWKVNEVNDAASPKVQEGDLWSFTTPDYGVVDDFESYNDQCNRIFFAWVDGFGHNGSTDCGVAPSAGNGSGSTVGNTNPPFAEKTVVHGGVQAMPLAYDNTGGKSASEATRTFDVAQDWTVGGAKTLVLYFRGTTDSSPGQFYVKFNGTRLDYPGATSAVALGVWKQWNIDLASVGTNLKAIQTFAVGVSGSGKGTLYVDDLLLYRVAPAVAEPKDPGTNGLSAYYKMEADVKDSSGKGYNGTANGNPIYVDSAAGFGKALQFEGIDDYVDLPIGSLMSTLSSATFSVWVNWSASGGNWQRVFDLGSADTNYLFLCPSGGGSLSSPMRFAIRMTTSTAESIINAPAVLPTGWHHVSVVFDGPSKTMQLWQDGSLMASGATLVLPKDLGNTTQNWLGRSQYTADAYYNGSIDEFRIYNRALSAGEVRYLAGDR
jgi:hypothetical protein